MYRIFIVEDDETIAKTVKNHLESWDYEVACVEKFSEIMQEFATFSPQLVLMDIKLPFFNGYHWCSEIRKISKVPVIFLSSASDNMNIVMAMNMGGDDFIAKPFDLDVLTVKIQAMLNLTKNELRILQTLMENKEKVVSRDELMTRLWEDDSYVDENTLSVNVNRLRKKLESVGLSDFILTKKGLGYRIA